MTRLRSFMMMIIISSLWSITGLAPATVVKSTGSVALVIGNLAESSQQGSYAWSPAGPGTLLESGNSATLYEPPLEISAESQATSAAVVKDRSDHTAAASVTSTLLATVSIQTSRPSAAAVAPSVYAVIVGIGNYRDNRLNPLYAANDAQGLYDILIAPQYAGVSPDNMHVLLNEEATARNIKRAIGEWLVEHADTDDTVIIYYAGYGAAEGNNTYWVTYDADIGDLSSTALNKNDIADMLDLIRSRRMVMFVDDRYAEATGYRVERIDTGVPTGDRRDKKAGTIATERSVIYQRNEKASSLAEMLENFNGTSRVVISASDDTQRSLESDEFQHGVFTYYLLEGLRGAADSNHDHVVEVEEIWDYVRPRVSETARSMGINQTPVMQGWLTAGIALTADLSGQEDKLRQEKARKLAKLRSVFEAGQLSVEHFTCGSTMVESGQSDRYLDALLADDLPSDIFSQIFSCP
jgi:uncharacterized caspase-like protein